MLYKIKTCYLNLNNIISLDEEITKVDKKYGLHIHTNTGEVIFTFPTREEALKVQKDIIDFAYKPIWYIPE